MSCAYAQVELGIESQARICVPAGNDSVRPERHGGPGAVP
jgi:hypothetical protein